jgi:hypothetical protein
VAECDIAFNLLTQSGAIRDEFEAAVFLAEYLTMLIDRGHSNEILMTNRSLSFLRTKLRPASAGRSSVAPSRNRVQHLAIDLARNISGQCIEEHQVLWDLWLQPV